MTISRTVAVNPEVAEAAAGCDWGWAVPQSFWY